MSVESMAIALHHSRATGTARLVLVGIANHDGDGGAWPAIVTLAKYANVHPRNVKRALRRLEELGEIATNVQGGGLADHDDFTRPNLYTFNLRCPVQCDGTRHHRTKRGPSFEVPLPVDNPTSDRVAVAPPGGGSATGGGGGSATQTVPTNPATNSVSASTTDRARAARSGCEQGCTLAADHDSVCVLPSPAPPPVEELARIREQLRQDTIRTTSRENNRP